MSDRLGFSTILVVVAHPDDEVLGCGGLIARARGEGALVSVVIVCGPTTSRGETDIYDRVAKETRCAMNELGVTEWVTMGLPDNRLDTVPLLTLVMAIEQQAAKLKPDLVLTHDASDLNVDHGLVSRGVLTACRPIHGRRQTLLTFETLSSTEWQDPATQGFVPTTFVDISNVLDAKLAAMRHYESELREFPHPRSLEGIQVRARQRGMEAGLVCAEAYRLVRDIRP